MSWRSYCHHDRSNRYREWRVRGRSVVLVQRGRNLFPRIFNTSWGSQRGVFWPENGGGINCHHNCRSSLLAQTTSCDKLSSCVISALGDSSLFQRRIKGDFDKRVDYCKLRKQPRNWQIEIIQCIKRYTLRRKKCVGNSCFLTGRLIDLIDWFIDWLTNR